MEEIDEIVKTLPELFKAHRRTIGKDLRFAAAIAEIAKIRDPRFSIRSEYWNSTIDFLDAKYPDWRGCPNPEYKLKKAAS